MDSQHKKETFILKAQLKHGNKYDYSKVDYKTAHTKVCIICPEHGEFWQEPCSHLSGCGCPKCGIIRTIKSKTSNTLNFINKSIAIHGAFYNYSQVHYINNSTNVCIICPEHGEFWQTPRSHLQGKGCPFCAKKKISNSRKYDTKLFVEKAQHIHCNHYIYDKVSYLNCFKKVCIICPKHGEFWQKPSDHLNGRGCPICGIENMKEKQSSNTEEFIQEAKKIHGDKYDYSKVNYINRKTKVCIICPKHGEFWQTPDCHLQNESCPNCNLIVSKAEEEIIKLLNPLKCEHCNRKLLHGKEIDIYIPSLKLGIEYNGLLWHSETYRKDKFYHLNKLEKCEKLGIELIQIFEDEWINHRKICEYKLKEICNIHKAHMVIENEYIIQPIIDNQKIDCFLEKFHLQGKSKFSICVAAYYHNEIIALMTFKHLNQNNWNINRIAINFDYQIEKFKENAISYFVKHYTVDNISISIDRRWGFDKKTYEKIGFHLDSIIKPKCFYYCKKEKYKRQIAKPSDKKYSKIWDCGNLKLLYNNNNNNNNI